MFSKVVCVLLIGGLGEHGVFPQVWCQERVGLGDGKECGLCYKGIKKLLSHLHITAQLSTWLLPSKESIFASSDIYRANLKKCFCANKRNIDVTNITRANNFLFR